MQSIGPNRFKKLIKKKPIQKISQKPNQIKLLNNQKNRMIKKNSLENKIKLKK